MRFIGLLLCLGCASWPISAAAQSAAETNRIADTMVRLCVGGGRTEARSTGGGGGADLSLRARGGKGNLKGEFKGSKARAEGLVNGLDNALSKIAADQVDKVRDCLRPVRERLLGIILPPTRQGAQTTITAPGGVAAGSIDRSQITIDMTPEQVTALATQLVHEMLAKGAGQPAPGAEQRVTDAVTDIARGASAGDTRLQQALGLLKAGDVAQATQLLRAVADERTARIQQDRRDAATAYRNLGAIAGLRDPKAALDAYSKAIELDPNDAESLFWAGWIEVDRGDLGKAEEKLNRTLRLTGPQDKFQHWVILRLGDIHKERGDLTRALASYRDSLAIAARLAQSDPGNAGWQRDLSVSYNKVGDVQRAPGDLTRALASYRDSLAIRERLAQSGPGNAGWQRVLLVSYSKVGDVQVAQGDLSGALASYRDLLAIAARLAQSDPGNAGWQRDLSVSYNKVGDVQVAQGDLSGALASYRDSLAIMERLAQSDAGNAGWQRDLAISNERLGDIYLRQQNGTEAKRAFERALDIYLSLARRNPDD